MAILSTLWMLLGLGYISMVLVTLRLLKHCLKGFLDIFDSGTALLGDDYVHGSFRGRPAWVSLDRSKLIPAIQIGIKGRFSLPFEVENFNSRRSAKIQGVLVWVVFVVVIFCTSTNGGTHITGWDLLNPTLLASPFTIRHCLTFAVAIARPRPLRVLRCRLPIRA